MPPADARNFTWLALAGLALLSALFWADCLVGPHAPLAAEFLAQMEPWRSEADLPPPTYQWDPLQWDGVAQFYPWRLFAARCLRRGEIALWNPHQFCGYPFLANGQSALLYPPNWLLALVGVRWGLGLLAALHYFLAAALTYLLCRRLRMGHAAGLLAGIAFAFGGFMVTWTELPSLMNSAVWLPGALLGVALVFERSRWGVPVLAGSLALTLLAGHMQIAAYVWLVTAVYALARVVWEAAHQRPARIGQLLGAVAVAALLSAGQVLPTFELARNSTRGAAVPSIEGFEGFHQPRALQPAHLITLLRPKALGSPALGTHTPTHYGLPYSEHCGFVGITTLVLALVGIGLSRTRHFGFFLLLAVAGLNVAMGGPLARWMYLHVPGLGQAGGFSRFLSVYTFAVAMAGGLGLDAICRGLRRRDAICLTDLADEDGEAIGDDEEQPEGSGDCPWNMSAATGLCVVALLVLVFELLPWGHEFLPRCRREAVYPVTRTIEQLQQAQGRVLALTPREDWGFSRVPRAALPPNSATVYEYDSVGGYDSLFPRSYREFVYAVEGGEPAPAANGNMLLPTGRPTWGLAGMAEVVTATGRETVPQDMTLPRAFVVSGRQAWLADAREVVARVQAGFDELIPVRPAQHHRDGPLSLTARLAAVTDEELLVATETLYPGWRAYVDGARREIVAVAGTFIGVPLQDGDRQVSLTFMPESVQVGLFGTLLGLGFVAGIVSAWPRRRGAGG